MIGRKLVVVLAMVLSLPIKAGTPVDFGLKGGFELTEMNFNASDLREANRAGFYAGPAMKFTLPVVGLTIDASLLYSQRDLKVDNSDIPSAEVMKYYLKESAYYDQSNATFHIKPLALCPIMMREDDFGGEATQYPLFWVKYSDLEPFLSRQTVMTSNVNNAAVMSMDDYFTLNKYKGKIYKTNNMLGKTLAQIAGGDSAKLSDEQKRIEAELEAFKNNIFGDQQKKDSLDSIANANPANVKAAKKARKERTKTEKASRRTKSSSSSSSSSSAARVSVRRQRH